jgi:hypothetical protein
MDPEAGISNSHNIHFLNQKMRLVVPDLSGGTHRLYLPYSLEFPVSDCRLPADNFYSSERA